MQYLRVDSTAIVAHQHFQMSARIFYFDFDTVRLCMHKCIQQGLAANAIDFIADQRPQWARNTINDNAEISFVVEGKFLSQSREGSLKVLAARFRCAQPTQRISTLFSDCTHQLQDPFQERFGGRVLWELVFRYIKLERGAQNTLQQRVMQFLRDAGTLVKSLLEQGVQSMSQLKHAKTIERHDQGEAGGKTQAAKPPGLPKCRLNCKGKYRLRAIPQAQAVRCNQAEAIGTGVEIGEHYLAQGDYAAPALTGAVQLVTVEDFFRCR